MSRKECCMWIVSRMFVMCACCTVADEVLINLQDFNSCACLPQILEIRNLQKVSAAEFMLQQLCFLRSVPFSYSWAFVVMNEVLLCLERWEMAEESTIAEHLRPFNIWPFNVPWFSQNSRTTQLLVVHRFMRTLQLYIDVLEDLPFRSELEHEWRIQNLKHNLSIVRTAWDDIWEMRVHVPHTEMQVPQNFPISTPEE